MNADVHASNGAAAGAPPPAARDALALLRSSHRRLLAMFDDCARLAGGDASASDRVALTGRLSLQMQAHATVTAELLVPAVQGNPQALQAAAASATAAAGLLGTLADLACDDGQVAAAGGAGAWPDKVSALGTALRAFVQHEEDRLLPAAATLDLGDTGDRIAARLAQLTADLGPD